MRNAGDESITFEYVAGANRFVPPQLAYPVRMLPGASFWFYENGGSKLVFEDGERVRFKDGEGRFIPVWRKYAAVHEPTGDFRVSGCNFRLMYLGVIDVFSLVRMPVRIDEERVRRARPLVFALNELGALKPGAGPAEVVRWKRAAYAFADEVLDWSEGPIAGGVASSDALGRLAPAVAAMRAGMDGRLTRAELARTTGLSESRFARLFVEAFGVTPLDHYRRLRVEEAQRLLATTDLTLAELAARLGFTDEFHLSKVFKRYVGESPSAWRAAEGKLSSVAGLTR